MKNKLLLVRQSSYGLNNLEKVVPQDGVKQGFYTREVLAPSGFQVIRADSQHFLLAEKGRESQIKLGEYGIDVPGFNLFIEPLFQRGKGLLYLDIGLMHLFSQRFQALVCDYLASPNPFLAAITEEDHPFLNAVREDPRVMVWHFDLRVKSLLEERVKEWIGRML